MLSVFDVVLILVVGGLKLMLFSCLSRTGLGFMVPIGFPSWSRFLDMTLAGTRVSPLRSNTSAEIKLSKVLGVYVSTSICSASGSTGSYGR